ncbi:HlyD family efflux transporter periplasmic adaptor subunit [uncultured Paraglaciecola sp.]|uniref:efflux RND transporter periplasmic adaptor subunit n=1 Tax=uncultured Paraglaciecola sp. TaxID=1765024 RepID=UPI002610FFD9|nr:HlyD family efflux transporter periplasmic adaptor subunit [uncultured Paraglaciecola sp.]
MKKVSRNTLTTGAAIILVAALIYGLWPKPTLVDIGTVSTGKMQITIDEEGYTRVDELYQVSAPISGRMLRIDLKPGDPVRKGETIIARILPNLLSVKESQLAKANVQIALSTVNAAKATRKRLASEFSLVAQRAKRALAQIKVGAISVDENDKFQQDVISKKSELAAATSMLKVHESELARAKATLVGSVQTINQSQEPLEIVDVKAPITGRVLDIAEKNETVLQAGAPILTLGNVKDDLELVIEMLSSDAVQVKVGQSVLLQNWNAQQTGNGTITRIEPKGFIKTSSLGVEERRVNVIVKPNPTEKIPLNLGHGFRVDASIIVWEDNNTTIVPVSAMFREQQKWAVFVIENDKTQLRHITIEQNNGTLASVAEGLSVNEQVVLYPSAELTNNLAVARR